VPAGLGGSHEFETWLAPVLEPAHTASVQEPHGEIAKVEHAAEETLEHAEHDPFEYLLMVISVLVAGCGILLAWLTYVKKAIDPARFSEAWAGVPYRTVFEKYYVDEIYQAVFVDGVLGLSKFLAAFDRVVIDGIVNGAATVTRWIAVADGAFDRVVIDGAVNLVGSVTMWVGARARQVQTGHIYSYLYAIVIGVVLIMFARLL
jgi:NADH-quinone oxidoreductase subunit L